MVGITWSRDIVDRSSRPGENALRYADLLAGAGILPMLVTPGEAGGLWRRMDGLLLPGGPDINPARYGQEPGPLLGAVDDDLDTLELLLFEDATAHALPVLAICRGQQVVNVALGGTLHQDIDHPQWDGDPGAATHTVELVPGTILREALGSDSLAVNSGHHQAIDRLAGALQVSARSGDGQVEGVESPVMRVLAVQWHPDEMPEAESSRRLTARFREWM